MKAICWAYDDDGRICRRPAANFDQQRGFMVCQQHGQNRETQTQNTTPVMSKTKTPPNGASTAPASEANEPREYRNIPEVDAKIDAYIKENPKRWAYIQGLPRERLERALALSDVQKLDRQQRFQEGTMKHINSNPELKQAYETLVKNVPEDLREEVMTQIARQARLTIGRAQSVTMAH